MEQDPDTMNTIIRPAGTLGRRGFLRGALATSIPFAAPRFLCAATPHPSERLHLAVIGTGGQGGGHARIWARLPESHLADRPGPLAEPWSTHHYRDFLQAIREERDPASPIESALQSTTICHLINIALVLQRPLRWDGKRERFIDDPVADRMLASPMRAPWNLNA